MTTDAVTIRQLELAVRELKHGRKTLRPALLIRDAIERPLKTGTSLMDQTSISRNVAFYTELLSRPEVRDRIATVEACQELIGQMEEYIPHDQLPPCYDWVVKRRNSLECRCGGLCDSGMPCPMRPQ